MNNNFLMQYGEVRGIDNVYGNQYYGRFNKEFMEELNREVTRFVEEHTDDFGGGDGSDLDGSVGVEGLLSDNKNSKTPEHSKKIDYENNLVGSVNSNDNSRADVTQQQSNKDNDKSNELMGSDELTRLNNNIEIVVGWNQDLSLIPEIIDTEGNRYRRIIYTLGTQNNPNANAGCHYVAAEIFELNGRTIVLHKDLLDQELSQEFVDYIRQNISFKNIIININDDDKLKKDFNKSRLLIDQKREKILELNDLSRLNEIDNIKILHTFVDSNIDYKNLAEITDEEGNKYTNFYYPIFSDNNSYCHYVKTEIFKFDNLTIMIYSDHYFQIISQIFIDYAKKFAQDINNLLILNIFNHGLRSEQRNFNFDLNKDCIMDKIRREILKSSNKNDIYNYNKKQIEVFEFSEDSKNKPETKEVITSYPIFPIIIEQNKKVYKKLILKLNKITIDNYAVAEIFELNNRTIILHKDLLDQELSKEFVDYIRQNISKEALILNIFNDILDNKINQEYKNNNKFFEFAYEYLDRNGIIDKTRKQILELNNLDELYKINNINIEDLLLESDPKIVFEYSDSDEEKENIELGYDNIKHLHCVYKSCIEKTLEERNKNKLENSKTITSEDMTTNLVVSQLTFVAKKDGEKKKSFLRLPISYGNGGIYNLKNITDDFDFNWKDIEENVKNKLIKKNNGDDYLVLFYLDKIMNNIKEEVFDTTAKMRLKKALEKEEIKGQFLNEKIPNIEEEKDNAQQLHHSEQQMYSFISNDKFIDRICNFLEDNKIKKLHSVILDIISTNKMCTWCALSGYSIMFEANKDEFFEKLKNKIKEKISSIKMSSNLKKSIEQENKNKNITDNNIWDNYKLIRVFHINKKEKEKGIQRKIVNYPSKSEKYSIKSCNKKIIGTDIENVKSIGKYDRILPRYTFYNNLLFPSGNANYLMSDNNPSFIGDYKEYYKLLYHKFNTKDKIYIIYFDIINSFVIDKLKQSFKQNIDKNAIILRAKDDRFILYDIIKEEEDFNTTIKGLNTIVNSLDEIVSDGRKKEETKVKDCRYLIIQTDWINYINSIKDDFKKNFFENNNNIIGNITQCTTIESIKEAIENIKKFIKGIEECDKNNIFNKSIIEELKKALNEDKDIENFGLEIIDLSKLGDKKTSNEVINNNDTTPSNTPQQSPEEQEETKNSAVNSQEESISAEDEPIKVK